MLNDEGWKKAGVFLVDKAVSLCRKLDDTDIELLQRVEDGMSILADVHRADVLLYCSLNKDRAAIVAHSRPHSVSPVYTDSLTSHAIAGDLQPLVSRTLHHGFRVSGQRFAIANGAPVVQHSIAIRNRQERIIGALCIETNLIEHERHRRRNRSFQWAVRQMQHMVARGELADAGALTPFGEHDGILLVDRQHRIRYASGIATNLYRRLGHVEGLVGKHLSRVSMSDEEIVAPVFDGSRCTEEETTENSRTWIKRGVPILAVFGGWNRVSALEPLLESRFERRVVASLILIRDTTESRLKEQEIKVKTAMIREVHHRVKNNLQTIAALLRMQARRCESGEVQQALQEGINRILSVAVVHEFLSYQEQNAVSLKEVAGKIVRQIRQGVMDPEKRIHIELSGSEVLLPAQQATSCALIINELLLNSVEHGFEGRNSGTITVQFDDENSHIVISVKDDGTGLPSHFDIHDTSSLGLQIVRTLVQDDLKGVFHLVNSDSGVQAKVMFPKSVSGGEQPWNERV